MLKWLMGLIGAVLAGIIVYWVTVGFDSTSPKKYGIYHPIDGASVSNKILVEGFCNETDTKSDLWLVVQPIQSPYYHPQIGPLPKDDKGKWKGVANIGDSGSQNVGEEYLIFIVASNSSASKAFSDYLDNPTQLSVIKNDSK